MSRRLRYLPLLELREGMVLGAPVVLPEHGVVRFSLPAGHVLTESNLRQLAVHRAEFLCIEEEETRTDPEREKEWERAETRLAYIFRSANLDEPAVAGLYNAVLAFRKS